MRQRQTLICKKGGRGVLRVRDVHGEQIRQVKECKYLRTVLCEGGGSNRDVQESEGRMEKMGRGECIDEG